MAATISKGFKSVFGGKTVIVFEGEFSPYN
jgi:hypothetical protein